MSSYLGATNRCRADQAFEFVSLRSLGHCRFPSDFTALVKFSEGHFHRPHAQFGPHLDLGVNHWSFALPDQVSHSWSIHHDFHSAAAAAPNFYYQILAADPHQRVRHLCTHYGLLNGWEQVQNPSNP